MKRIGYLYEKIYAWDNLLLAYQKARRGKHGESTEEFCYDWERQLLHIQQALEHQDFTFGEYHRFLIHEPKERQITAAPFRDRVVHHAICNILGTILDRPLIVNSFACRKGKGLHRAVKQAFYLYRNSKYHYRLDISKFYYTIDHEILMAQIGRKIKDPKLLQLLRKLLATHESGREYYQFFESDDLFDMTRSRGLPIGNLTSQLCANFYLSILDHYVREDLGFTSYIRYMDDILIFSDDRDNLKNVRSSILMKLSGLRLHPNPRKDSIQDNRKGVDFLGFRLIDNTIRIRSQNLSRFRRRLKIKSRIGNTDLNELLHSYNGHLGFLLGGHTKSIINAVLENIEFHNQEKSWKLIV